MNHLSSQFWHYPHISYCFSVKVLPVFTCVSSTFMSVKHFMYIEYIYILKHKMSSPSRAEQQRNIGPWWMLASDGLAGLNIPNVSNVSESHRNRLRVPANQMWQSQLSICISEGNSQRWKTIREEEQQQPG